MEILFIKIQNIYKKYGLFKIQLQMNIIYTTFNSF